MNAIRTQGHLENSVQPTFIKDRVRRSVYEAVSTHTAHSVLTETMQFPFKERLRRIFDEGEQAAF
jgi:hypothetical protein